MTTPNARLLASHIHPVTQISYLRPLYAYAWYFSFGLVILSCCLAIFPPDVTASFWAHSGLLILSIAVLPLLLRPFHTFVSARRELILHCLTFLFLSVQTGGLFSPALFVFPLLIVTATLLMGFRGGIFTAVIGGVGSTFFLILQLQQGTIQHSIFVWIVQVFGYLMTTVLVGVTVKSYLNAIREVQQNVQKARQALGERDEELHRRMVAENELRYAVKMAEHASESKSLFLANFSHELRTPLNAIIGYSEMLIEEDPKLTVREASDDLGKIKRAGKHLLTLINDILDLSKIESGNMSVSFEWFDVTALINEIADVIIPMVDRQSNMFVIDLSPELGPVYSDQMRLRQILLNLLSNAAKFTEDGMIILKARPVLKDNQEFIYFEVTDTGVGIPPDKMNNLFKPFSQIENTAKGPYKGTGLGLALSLRFAELLKGGIRVSSAPNEGSTFTFYIPKEVQPLVGNSHSSLSTLPEVNSSSSLKATPVPQ